MESLMQRLMRANIPPEDWTEWMDLMVEVSKIEQEKRILYRECKDIEYERRRLDPRKTGVVRRA